MMKRISGWMRVWIVLSALFFVGSYIYGIREYNLRNYEIYQLYFYSCESTNKSENRYKECLEYAEEKSEESKKAAGGIPVQVLVFSIIPLFLIWVLGFISYKIFKWIRRGFEN